MRILVIEKNRNNGEVWEGFLLAGAHIGSVVMFDNQRAFQVVRADFGLEALVAAYTLETAPNGLEILRQARQMGHWQGKPLVLVTGHADLDTVIEGECKKLGIELWIRPVDIEERLAELARKIGPVASER